jgi:hypothetical protein
MVPHSHCHEQSLQSPVASAIFLNSVVPGIEPVVVVPSITIGATTLIKVDLVAPSCSHVVIVLVYISGDFTISMCGARKS